MATVLFFVDRFPFATWAKVMRETLTDYNTSLLKTVPFNGVLQLREAIADHLNRYRGMQVSADHIIIGAGTEYLYNRLLQLLGPDVKFGVENPGYRKITKIYDENGVDWDYVNIDDKGMKVDELRMKDINVAHVSPEHHFPIGLVMPVARRQKVLLLGKTDKGDKALEEFLNGLTGHFFDGKRKPEELRFHEVAPLDAEFRAEIGDCKTTSPDILRYGICTKRCDMAPTLRNFNRLRNLQLMRAPLSKEQQRIVSLLVTRPDNVRFPETEVKTSMPFKKKGQSINI